MAPDFHFGFLMLFFTVFTFFLVQIPFVNANPDYQCPNNELKISNNSILGSPPGMNGKLRRQFQLEGPEKCSDEFTIVFPLEIDVNSDELENGAFQEDYKQFWKFKCNDVESTTEFTTETEQSTTPILTTSTSTPTTVPKRRTVDYIYNVAGQVSANGSKFIGFSLCAPNKKGEDCWLRMNMTEGKVEVFSKTDGQESAEVFQVDSAIHGNSSFNLTVSVRHYYIEFHIEYGNGTNSSFKFKHWPAFWYKTISFVGIEELQYESIGNWNVVNFNKFEDQKLPTQEEMFPVNFPFSVKFPEEIRAQSTITIRGHTPKKGSKFNIKLLRNAPEANNWIGDTVAKLTLDFVSNNIFLNSKYDAKKEEIANMTFLVPDTYFEAILIAKDKTEFEMIILSSDGKENLTFPISLPLWSITHLNIDGDVDLFEHPRIVLKEKSETDYSLTLFPPLDVGDVISIKFTPGKDSTECSIWLLYGAKEHIDHIGHTPLRIKFKYDDKTVAQTFMTSTKIDYCCKLQYEDEVGESFFKAGTSAALMITFNQDAFNLNVNEGDVGNYEYKKSRFPPWSVDHIQVIGDSFKNAPIIEVHRKEKENKLEMPYIMVLNKSLVVGDTIVIEGQKWWSSKSSSEIIVYLLHGALNHHEKIGQTVLQIKIGETYMRLNAFIGGYWKKQYGYDLKKYVMPDYSFTLRIKVEKDMYKIALDRYSETENPFHHQLPIWAVQYIRIEGELTLAQAPAVVH